MSAELQSPEDLYGPLFLAVQRQEVFLDGKTFVDCTPQEQPSIIRDFYEAEKNEADFDLAAFVETCFERPTQHASGFESDPSRSVEAHIAALWPVLTRKPDRQSRGTLIALPKSYIVPGGRFGEIYYWDSYFTMLGLRASRREAMIKNMVDNFAHLINTVGYIPNGNRTYFISRSQPPFFAAMVQLLADGQKDTLAKYLPQLEKEYAFWMDGADNLSVDQPSHRRVVRLPDGSVLNRYWDDRNSPRAEMYHDDETTAAATDRVPEELYRDLRAACESGWDFSARWLRDPDSLASIRTTDLLPVDLNCLLYHLEETIALAYSAKGATQQEQQFLALAKKRKTAIQQYCWSASSGWYYDYDFVAGEPTDRLSLGGVFPMFFGLAETTDANAMATVVKETFLADGGVVSTPYYSGQQWDAPNGWAPLQWITIQGLRRYGQADLADMIKDRWVALNKKVYQNTGKLVEKYNVVDMGLEAGGGEYPVQDGFGWTNGVLLALLSE